MCGIAGIYSLRGMPVNARALQDMVAIQQHRGPDDSGVYVRRRVALGHRRLSILDTSSAGRQPMRDAQGRYVVTYNGEIYNYVELRALLRSRGYRFRTETDTEVLLAAFDCYGPQCLERFRGMFAFAIYDERSGRLFCARDRLGVKPFVFAVTSGHFVFASEEKAVLSHPEVNVEFDRSAVRDFLGSGYGYVDLDSRTFFRGVRQLDGGSWLTVSPTEGLAQGRYWTLRPRGETASATKFCAGIRDRFEDAVRIRLRSDVPVGAALSGGIDSSAIVGLLGAMGREVPTFSACFEQPEVDERPYMDAVAARVRTQVHRVFPQGDALAETLPAVIYHLDRPYAGPSVFAQWCVMKLAREQGVPVVLNGQGGDELFGGYPKYYAAHLAELVRQGNWRQARATYVGIERAQRPGADRILRHLLRPSWSEGWRMRIGRADRALHPSLLRESAFYPPPSGTHDRLNRELRRGLLVSPLPALLRNDDRNGMAHGVESRSPFMDHELVEFVSSAPSNWKIRKGVLKWSLREAASDVLPRSVHARTDKLGFATPTAHWLLGPLKGLLHDALGSAAFRDQRYLRPESVSMLLQREELGRGDAFRLFGWLSLALFCALPWGQPATPSVEAPVILSSRDANRPASTGRS